MKPWHFFANERETYGLKELENGHYSFTKTTGWHPEYHTLGRFPSGRTTQGIIFPRT